MKMGLVSEAAAQSYNYNALLHECSLQKSIARGRQIHARLISLGVTFLALSRREIVTMYAKCHHPQDARKVFEEMPQPSKLSCNSIIQSFTSSGMLTECLHFYKRMHHSDTVLDEYAFPCALKSCGALCALNEGRQIHSCALKSGLESHVYVANALVSMYAKCGSMDDSRRVFDIMGTKDVVIWTSLVGGYLQNGHPRLALDAFSQMRALGISPDKFTFATALKCCGQASDLRRGKEIHSQLLVREAQMECDNMVRNALVSMYAKCASLDEACNIFGVISHKDAFSWNAIISGYALSGHFDKASTYLADMRKAGLVPDVVTWTAMLSGYAQNGHGDEALDVFRRMLRAGVRPNSVTLLNCLQACVTLSCLHLGRQIHAYVLVNGSSLFHLPTGNSLVDMYSKCGHIADMCRMFEGMPNKDVITWNSLISGYARHGHGHDALLAFGKMHKKKKNGLRADDTTFLAVLTACSHSGLVEEGREWFRSMQAGFGIRPRIEHYVTMVDLLGRAGHLQEAQDFIKSMPLEPNADVWTALLGASRIHQSLQVAERAAEQIFLLEPDNVGCYVTLSNLYAELGRWDGVMKVRKLMNSKGLRKIPGCSWIHVNSKVYEFTSKRRVCPHSQSQSQSDGDGDGDVEGGYCLWTAY